MFSTLTLTLPLLQLYLQLHLMRWSGSMPLLPTPSLQVSRPVQQQVSCQCGHVMSLRGPTKRRILVSMLNSVEATASALLHASRQGTSACYAATDVCGALDRGGCRASQRDTTAAVLQAKSEAGRCYSSAMQCSAELLDSQGCRLSRSSRAGGSAPRHDSKPSFD